MTHQERILAVMERRPPDRIPWVPRLELWYEAARRRGTMPARYEGCSLREIALALGAGVPARDGKVAADHMKHVDVTHSEIGGETVTRYRTPVGTVETRHRGSETLRRAGIMDRETEPMIKGAEDYRVVQYMVEHTEVTATPEAYLAYEEQIGEEGVPMVALGDCPMGTVLREYIGWNRAYYELHDNRAAVERLRDAVRELMRERVRLAAESPAKLFLLGLHFDSQMTSPPLFREYFVPDCQEYSEMLHAAGKQMTCHADSDASLLLELIEEAGYDMAECFVTAPMVKCTLAQARAVWGNRVVIWGGIPSGILCEPYDDDYFETYMRDVFRTIAPGDAFILGVADNVMPEAKIERVERVGEMLESWGDYPIDGTAIS